MSKSLTWSRSWLAKPTTTKSKTVTMFRKASDSLTDQTAMDLRGLIEIS